MNRRRIFSVVVGVVLVGVAGCGIGSSSTSNVPAPDAPSRAEPAGESAGSAAIAERSGTAPDAADPVASDVQRAVISRAQLSITREDLPRARSEAIAIAVAAGGHVENEVSTSDADGELRYVDLVVRVPAGRFTATLDRLSELGAVRSLEQTTEDVTGQAVDLEAKVKAQAAAAERLRTLMARAENVTDVIAVEAQLTNRQAELDALRSRRDWLAAQTEQATIAMTLARPEPAETVRTGFARGLYDGWHALTSTVGGGLTALGWILPFLPVLAVLVVAGWWVKRRVARRRAVVVQT